MSKLIARFDAIMAYTLDAGARSTQQSDWNELAAALNLLVGEERRLAPPPDCTDADMETCRFAVYAWVDEKLLGSGRTDALLWMTNSLQQRYFHTSNAGVEFYDRLNTLLAEQDALHMPQPGEGPLPHMREQGGRVDTPPESLSAKLARWKSRPATSASTPASTYVATSRRMWGTPVLPNAADQAGRAHLAEIIQVYAVCLLYGFKGELSRPGQEALRREVLTVCAELVAPPDIWPLLRRELSDSPYGKKSSSVWKTLFLRLEPMLHILVPALICLGFYVYCADIVAGITLPSLIGM